MNNYRGIPTPRDFIIQTHCSGEFSVYMRGQKEFRPILIAFAYGESP